MNTPASLQSILPGIAKRYGLGSNLDASHLLLRYNTLAAELLERRDVTRGAFIKNNILFVYVTSPIVAQEVMTHKLDILDALNRLDSPYTLKNIITKLKRSLSDQDSNSRTPEFRRRT